MNDQFPGDLLDGKPRTVFQILSITLDPTRSSEFADRATALIRDVVAGLEGFIEGQAFVTDDGAMVSLMTAWKSRDLWAKAHWNAHVQDLLSEYDQTGAAFKDAMYYGWPRVVAG